MGGERRISIGPRTIEVLISHRARQLKERMAATTWTDAGLVFPNERGWVCRRESAARSLKRLLNKAGFSTDFRFHDLRHTAGTLALR